MLGIVEDRHSVESCVMQESDAERVAVENSWLNGPVHEAFVLVDAFDTHNIDEMIVSTGLSGRTTTRVLSVFAHADAVPAYTEGEFVAGAQE